MTNNSLDSRNGCTPNKANAVIRKSHAKGGFVVVHACPTPPYSQLIMIDYLLGRPSQSWKRTQVDTTITWYIPWIWRLVYGSPNAPRFLWLRRANRHLRE
jgi:hypothetical protein